MPRMSYVCSHFYRFRIDSAVPSGRESLSHSPTLKRVGYSQISFREMADESSAGLRDRGLKMSRLQLGDAAVSPASGQANCLNENNSFSNGPISKRPALRRQGQRADLAHFFLERPA